MTDKRKRPMRGRIGGGAIGGKRFGKRARAAMRRADVMPRPSGRAPGALLDDKARAFLVILLIATAFCALSGLVGPHVPNAFAVGGYTHVFPNGNTVQVHGDGSVSGTCTLSGGATVGGVYGGTVTMPDGNSYHAACYERYLGVPNYKYYPGPCDGTYPFEATRNADGTYFVVILSQDAAHGAPGAGDSDKYPYQRCYTKNWKLVLEIDVSFVKRSADHSITNGNPEYSLAGATFDIFDASSDAKVATVTMDDSGRAHCKLAPNKKYYAVETKAPRGFALHPDRIPFSTGTQQGTFTFEDRPGSVTLTIQKRDSVTKGEAQKGLSLKGAEYEVSSLSTPGWKTKVTTDRRGIATAQGIPLGRISVKEIKAPEGYKTDSSTHTYDVGADQLDASGIVKLEPRDEYVDVPCAFDIEITKFLEGGGDSSGLQEPGAGVRFLIISNSSGRPIGTITTDEHGKASTAGKWFGDGVRGEGIRGAIPYDIKGYTVREDPDSTPEGYQPCPAWTIGTDQMSDGATLHYIVDNDFVGSRIQIIKHDAVSGQRVPLSGFAFQVLDKEKRPVSQEVWHPNHMVLDTFTTDETGSVTLPETLKPGTYYIREIASVKPYLINDDDIEFKIENDTDTEPITVVRVSDVQVKGSATITKRCTDDRCPWCEGGKGLSGAVFDVVALEDVVSPDGTVAAVKDEVLGSIKTNDDGIARIDGLPLGSGSARYAFVETQPAPGHVLNDAPIPFTLTWKDGDTDTVYAESHIKNVPTQTIIDKFDGTTKAALRGAEFDVWPRQLEYKTVNAGDGTGALLITNRTGERNWKQASLTIALDGSGKEAENRQAAYTLDDFSIDEDVAVLQSIRPGSYLLTLSSSDDEAAQTRLIVTIEPNTDTHVRVESSGLQLRGHTIEAGKQKQLDGAFAHLDIPAASDERGQLLLKHLPASEDELDRLLGMVGNEKRNDHAADDDVERCDGEPLTWCVQETAAPDGYIVDPSTRTFTVQTKPDQQGGTEKRISVENDFTRVDIGKRSAETEELLEGAQLEITDESGNPVDRWTSSSEPHRIERLAPGTYSLHEVVPPQSHDGAEPMTFDVKPTADVQTVTMYDERLSVAGRIDKRQEIARPIAPNSRPNGDGLNRAEPIEGAAGEFSYTLDYRNESSSWVDEFTVEDHLLEAEKGMAELSGITVGRAQGDHDGTLNVWYQTNLSTEGERDTSEANATPSDGHRNPWLDDPSVIAKIGEDRRVLDYAGWRVWTSGVSATKGAHLDVDDLKLGNGEVVTRVRLEYGSVSDDFSTRSDGWDAPGYKDAHDDWNPLPTIHPAAGNGDATCAPTILHMKVLDAYGGGCELDNHASVSIYRNGGGQNLEAHDEDAVHQEALSWGAVPLLDQTGSNTLVRAAVSLAIGGGLLMGYRYLRRTRWMHPIAKNPPALRCQRGGGRHPLGHRRHLLEREKIPKTL